MPAVPAMARDDEIAGPQRGLHDGIGPGRSLDAGAGRACLQRRIAGRVGERGEAGASSAMAVRASASASRPPATAATVKRLGLERQHLSGRAADRAGRAEDHDDRAACPRSTPAYARPLSSVRAIALNLTT